LAKEKILVVDDNREILALIADYMLKPNGYVVSTARDGVDGLEKYRADKPDLILLDLEMPRLNGLGVIEELHAERSETPIVLMTSHGSEDLAVTVFRKGVRDYIIKPVDTDELLVVVEKALVEARLRREKAELTETLMRTNRDLEIRVKELNALYGIGRSVTSMLDLDRLLGRIVEAAVYITGAEEGSLLLLDEGTNELFMRSAQGLDEKYAREFRLRVEDSLAGQVIQTGEPLLISGASTHKVKTAYLAKAILYVPLKTKGKIMGVLTVDNRVLDKDFTRNDLFLLSLLSDYASIGIENARLFGQIENERQMLEAILSGTDDIIIVTDESDRVILMNKSARCGFDLSHVSVTGSPLEDLIRNQELFALYDKHPLPGAANRAEIPLSNGQTLLATLSAISGIGRVAVMQDITQLKKLDQVKSDFVATVSHDLRSPLTSIRGFADLLPVVGSLNEQQNTFLQKIQRGVGEITNLINDLLDVGRIEAGMDLETQPCDLTEIVASSVEKFRTQASERGQNLTFLKPPMSLCVQGNKTRLEQVVSNLVSNAVKYTPDKGTIDVNASSNDQFVVVSVKDNGIGIPLAEQPFIFDKFYRVQSEETLGISGTGLGLSIVKSIVEKHFGRIWVESEPGRGSNFVFILPKMGDALSEVQASAA